MYLTGWHTQGVLQGVLLPGLIGIPLGLGPALLARVPDNHPINDAQNGSFSPVLSRMLRFVRAGMVCTAGCVRGVYGV